eukprot:808513-Pelagomonas_calceolata.AAC.1
MERSEGAALWHRPCRLPRLVGVCKRPLIKQIIPSSRQQQQALSRFLGIGTFLYILHRLFVPAAFTCSLL